MWYPLNGSSNELRTRPIVFALGRKKGKISCKQENHEIASIKKIVEKVGYSTKIICQ